MGAANRKQVPGPAAEMPGAESFGPVLLENTNQEPTPKKVGMRQATAQARREVALALPGVVRALAREALTGSVTHLKLFLELSGALKGGLAAPEKVVRERTLEEILVEQWELDKANAALQLAERNRARAEEVLSGV